MSTFSFPAPETYGQTLPTAHTVPAAASAEVSENGELFNLITLAELTLYKNPKDVAAAAERLLGKTDIITDEQLRTSVRLALAEASAEPENFPQIRSRRRSVPACSKKSRCASPTSPTKRASTKITRPR